MSHRHTLPFIVALAVTGAIVSGIVAVAAAVPAPARATRAGLTRPAQPIAPAAPHTSEARPSSSGEGEDEDADQPEARDEWFYSFKTAGNPNFTIADAASARQKAANEMLALQSQPHIFATGPAGFSGAWTPMGPNPIVQLWGNEVRAMAGRIGALAVRSTAPYTIYLGAAQGGMWVSSTLTSDWTSVSAGIPTQAIGAIALAPSNENIIYVGTGEGALSGDSYFANGMFKSTDGGRSFHHIGGDAIDQVSVAKLAIDPTDANHVYAATIVGIRGAHAQNAPAPTRYGIWETKDGGTTWQPRMTTAERKRGATDIVMDPRNPMVLYASFWMQGVVKSVDGGLTWQDITSHFPIDADWGSPNTATRVALGISHPASAAHATLYAGFDWTSRGGRVQPSTVWKSTDDGATWVETNRGLAGYCSGQCDYDNVILADSNNPDLVYVLGLWNYQTGGGGVWRSRDGGASWQDLGYGQHPDYHAIAMRRDKPDYVVVGNDGGVWSSATGGGRGPGEPYTATQWVNLNGTLNDQGQVVSRTGLQIAQFTSVGQHPSEVKRLYGGTQDNGTQRRSLGSNTWVDMAGGDGGQVVVDKTNPQYVYGTYYDLSPYRFSDGMIGNFDTNQAIQNGITTSERSAFYIPFIIDPEYPNRLYLASFHVYRTDDRGDHWQSISGDLTSGCTDRAQSPTNVSCVITALGASAGSPALYAGSGDARIYRTDNAYIDHPTWTRVDKVPLPVRPVQAFAVDASNDRIAYAAYGGFNAATPVQTGHVFKTMDGGTTWTDISGDLPDMPVNSVVLDASSPDTVYVGTDVGPMITTNGGVNWLPLGTGFPLVAVNQLDLNSYTRQIAVGTHGRGAYAIRDEATTTPALEVRATAADVPVGPDSLLTYTVRVKNVGNAPATGVVIRNPLPTHTGFVAAPDGGTMSGNDIVWQGKTVPVSGTLTVGFTVRVDKNSDVDTGTEIVNDGLTATSSEGPSATGSRLVITVAPAYAVTMTADVTADGTRAGQTITYTLTVENRGYTTDHYDLSIVKTAWETTLWNAAFTAPVTSTPLLAPGQRYTFGVRVKVPDTAANGAVDTATIVATSAGSADVTAEASIKTTAVTVKVLIVDNSAFDPGEADSPPDVMSYYAAAVQAAGYSADQWSIVEQGTPPERYLRAHDALVWYTGSAYPGPFTPYEDELARYLNDGGHMFMSSEDGLDQAAGTTAFVHDYLHIDWDGTERQNDKGSAVVTAYMTNSVTAGLGAISLTVEALYPQGDYSDQLTLVAPAKAAFHDDKDMPNALTVSDGPYKVMFLAFPFEALGAANDRANVMSRALDYFGLPPQHVIYLPINLLRPVTSPW